MPAMKRLQEDIMQANLKRGKAASGARSAGPFVAILAGVPLIATLAICAPDRALAACGATHPGVVHSAAGGGGVHSGGGGGGGVFHSGGGGGGGGGGCPNGSSAPALHGLPMAASGRVLEGGGHAARTAAFKRTAATSTATRAATTRIANVSAHLSGIRPPHAVVRR
jgi:hypothetical protein